ncbi:MAG: hypothetical protein ACTHXA_08620 [Gulosibacter sp.]|uniref:hypothetical protein n=1 Tax=Gulosibacter sp. TaxID=2817531 RepID=UPI003F907F50
MSGYIHGPGKPQYPPFPKGNALSLSAGYTSPRVYGELANQLAAGLVEDRPDLAPYPEAIAAWATAEAQVALLRRHLDNVGIIDAKKNEPRYRLAQLLATMERSAAQHRSTLGLDPRSEAELAKVRAEASTLAVDLGALMERGKAALAAREAAGIPAPPDLAAQALAAAQHAAPAFRPIGEEDTDPTANTDTDPDETSEQ